MMMRVSRMLFLVASVWLLAFTPYHGEAAQIEYAFSPNGGAGSLIVKTINSAQKTIRLAAYSFTSHEIIAALIRAQQRGVDVRLVLDKSNKDNNSYAMQALKKSSIEYRINSRYAIMHNKFIVFDNRSLETGSYNFSEAAERRNAENVLVLTDMPELAKEYTHVWENLWGEAQ